MALVNRAGAFFWAAMHVCATHAGEVALPSFLCAPGTALETVHSGAQFTEGPACDSAGNLYFTDRLNSTGAGSLWMMRSTGGACERIASDLNYPCGSITAPGGRLIFGERGKLSCRENDKSTTVLANGDSLKNVNDMTATAAGGIFFTGSEWDRASRVYYLSESGVLHTSLAYGGAPDASFPNGIEYVEEKKRMYVCLSQKNIVMSYRVDGSNNLVQPRQFAAVKDPDGIAVDSLYNVWVAEYDYGKVLVFDSSGARLGEIRVDQPNVTNCTFGGADRRTLYVTACSMVYKIRLLVPGRLPHRPATQSTIGPSLRRAKKASAAGHTSRHAIRRWRVD